jgi:hypothetical protein
MIAEPDLLLLDEPTSGVDIRTRDEVLHLLAELNAQGVTIVLTTHELNSVAAHLPWVVCVNRRVIAAGDPDVVFNDQVLNATYDANLRIVRQDGHVLVADAAPHRVRDALRQVFGENGHRHGGYERLGVVRHAVQVARDQSAVLAAERRCPNGGPLIHIVDVSEPRGREDIDWNLRDVERQTVVAMPEDDSLPARFVEENQRVLIWRFAHDGVRDVHAAFRQSGPDAAAVASLCALPASISSCVIAWRAVKLHCSPTSKMASSLPMMSAPRTKVADGSVTVTSCSVTLPVFITVMV